jgi:hypothetical protein
MIASTQPNKANLSNNFLRLLITDEIGLGRKVSDSESSKSMEYFFCGVSSMVFFKMLHFTSDRKLRVHRHRTKMTSRAQHLLHPTFASQPESQLGNLTALGR